MDQNEPSEAEDAINRINLAAEVVSAYVANNSLPASDLAALLAQVHAALTGISAATAPLAENVDRPTPAQIRKSITSEYLISFEDGKPYKTLRRHLTLRGLSPEQYRAKWGLNPDYPMVSASYAEQRSELARALGFGRRRPKAASSVADRKLEEGGLRPLRRTKKSTAAAGGGLDGDETVEP